MKNKYKSMMLLLKLIAKNDPLYIVLIILNAIIPAINTIVNVFVPMIFINQLTNPREFPYFVKLIIIIVLAKFILTTLSRIFSMKEFVRRMAINNSISFEIGKKAMDLTYQNIENPNVLDLKERANAALNFGSLHQLLACLSEIIKGFTTILATAIIIINFSPYLVAFSMIISILIILVDKKMSSYTQDFDQGNVAVNRRFSYYFSLMAGKPQQKDIRVFDLGGLIYNKTQSYLDKMMARYHEKFSYETNMNSIKIFLESIIRLVSYAYVAMRTLSANYGSQITFGEFSVIISANENFMKSFQEIFSETAGFLISLKNLEPLYEFMILDIEDEKSLKIAEDFQSLEFKNVSFAYPGNDRLILDDVSFKINKGEKISIVGVNNAGKTTMVKLILRFFEINKGEILYNGISIKEYKKSSLYDKISAVLQDFSIMPFTIKENIIANKDYQKEKMDKILEDLDLKERIQSLDSGIETYLDKDIFEDATDFSLGQKQKLAIGRCLYQNPDLIILDEPTASLDPLSEAKIYEHFNQMTKGKTAIFISHRMSSSRFTDKVLVVDDAKIMAFDSHENLMKYDNIYRRLYQAQAKYYQ